MKYLAHRSEDGREQTVLQHLEGTAEQCAAFAAAFGAEEQGRLAGLSHDIGKYADAFQKRLDGSTQRVDHATAGAYECYRRRQPFAAFAVAGHHGGLPNGGGKGDSGDSGTFLGRMHRGQSGQLEPYRDWESQLPAPAGGRLLASGDAMGTHKDPCVQSHPLQQPAQKRGQVHHFRQIGSDGYGAGHGGIVLMHRRGYSAASRHGASGCPLCHRSPL